ncbi:MAG: hypothetical protein IJO87_02610 [Eggerthellaceae bacterium]|nr:hypothetical protein [Eggerthellaceae bacterium]
MCDLGCDADVVSAKDFTRWGARPEDALHLLTDSRCRGKDVEGCEIHTLSGLGDLPGLFLELEPGLCATSPELTFIMAAQDLDLIDQILLGVLLLGLRWFEALLCAKSRLVQTIRLDLRG